MTGARHVAGGIVTGRFTDHHVHLQLVDHAQLAGSRLGRVVDLGADPGWITQVAQEAQIAQVAQEAQMEHAGADAQKPASSIRSASTSDEPPVIEYAGAFLTAPGGYPSDRVWAPEGAVREVADAASAASAVAELATHGVTCVKAVLHSDAGPTLDDETFRAIVAAARSRGLTVVAHAEGSGQAQRAARLGAGLLAHAPFTERLGDGEIAAQAASVQWISTLSIHDDRHRSIAIDNVRRFAAAGGTVLYGTDMGNGQTPLDLNPAELDALREAGLDDRQLLRALAPTGPDALFLPDGDPASARPLTPAHLKD